jgi:thiol-disulfide isomerase/thioredoxin
MERKLILRATKGQTNWWFMSIVIILAAGSITFLFEHLLDAPKSYAFHMPSEGLAGTSPADGLATGQAQASSIVTWTRELIPIGIPAPDLDLQALVGNARFRLSSYRKLKPVMLVFGSFTCDFFQKYIPELNRLHEKFKDRAAFVFIAAPEAGHKINGFEFLLEDRADNPMTNVLKRRERIDQARAKAGLNLPGFFDGPNYEASQAYLAWPGRLVLVDVEGQVAHDFRTPLQGWSAVTIAPQLEKLCSMAETEAAVRSVGAPKNIP